jgi:hypothetical protein
MHGYIYLVVVQFLLSFATLGSKSRYIVSMRRVVDLIVIISDR